MPKYHVHRSIEINASPEQVFDTVADYNTWPRWSPWLCCEPAADVHVSENSNSVGSNYSWKGEITGQGEIEHKRLEPGKLIEDEIRFVKPFKSTSSVMFDLERVGDGTRITWRMRGSLPWFLFWMKSMMQTFIGMDYQRGLKMLKEYVETGEVRAKTAILGVETVGPIKMIGIRAQCSMKDVSSSMEQIFAEVKEKLTKNKSSDCWNEESSPEGISVYHDFNLKTQVFDYTGGFVVPATTEVPDGMSTWSCPESKALIVQQVGSYEHMGNGWSAGHQYARYKKLKLQKVGFEVYRNNPEDTQPAELHTDIHFLLR